jgi:excisionase family DNA binding protein
LGPERARAHLVEEDAMRSKSAQLLSLEDTALVLGIGRSTIYRAVRDGKVPFPVHRIGGKWYVPKRALQRFLDGEEQVPEEDVADTA